MDEGWVQAKGSLSQWHSGIIIFPLKVLYSRMLSFSPCFHQRLLFVLVRFLHLSHRRVRFCILSVLFWSCHWAHHWCIAYWWSTCISPPAGFNNLADFQLLFQHANESSTRMCTQGIDLGVDEGGLEEQLSLNTLQLWLKMDIIRLLQ